MMKRSGGWRRFLLCSVLVLVAIVIRGAAMDAESQFGIPVPENVGEWVLNKRLPNGDGVVHLHIEAPGMDGSGRIRAEWSSPRAPRTVALTATGTYSSHRYQISFADHYTATQHGDEIDVNYSGRPYFDSAGQRVGPREPLAARWWAILGYEGGTFKRVAAGSGGAAFQASELPEIARLQQSCDTGPAANCTLLADRYAQGNGVKRDDVRAVALYRRACERRDGEGCTGLGMMYANGSGVARNDVLAARFYRQGCELGGPVGCTNLGAVLSEGRIGAPDDVGAVAMFKKGCEGGDSQGCDSWGYMVMSGRGERRDDSKALRLFKQGCEGNSAFGCTHAGISLLQGKGEPVNERDGLAFLKRGCDLGDQNGCQAFTAVTAPSGPSGSGLRTHEILACFDNAQNLRPRPPGDLMKWCADRILRGR